MGGGFASGRGCGAGLGTAGEGGGMDGSKRWRRRGSRRISPFVVVSR